QLCVLHGRRTVIVAAATNMKKPKIALIPAVTKNGITSAPELKSSTIGGAAIAMLFLAVELAKRPWKTVMHQNARFGRHLEGRRPSGELEHSAATRRQIDRGVGLHEIDARLAAPPSRRGQRNIAVERRRAGNLPLELEDIVSPCDTGDHHVRGSRRVALREIDALDVDLFGRFRVGIPAGADSDSQGRHTQQGERAGRPAAGADAAQLIRTPDSLASTAPGMSRMRNGTMMVSFPE